MGFDVYGKAPREERGEYFRASVWFWHPLWEYVCEVAKDVIPDDVARHGHDNGGAGLDADQSQALASRLRAELSSGRTNAYATGFPRRVTSDQAPSYVRSLARLAAIMDLASPVLECRCPLCTGTGDVLTDGGACFFCGGTGTIRQYRSPQFSVEKVKQFAEFLEACGGFAIQ